MTTETKDSDDRSLRTAVTSNLCIKLFSHTQCHRHVSSQLVHVFMLHSLFYSNFKKWKWTTEYVANDCSMRHLCIWICIWQKSVKKKKVYIIKENWWLEDVRMIAQAFRGNTLESWEKNPHAYACTSKGHNLLIIGRLAESCHAFMVSPFCLILLVWFCIRDEHSGTQEVTGPWTGKSDRHNSSSVTIGCLVLQIIRRFVVFHWKGNKGCV